MAKGCYTPKFLPASFKGFAFEATVAESSHGRRGAEGEFPFGEDTDYADMGRRIRKYQITARFADNDHIAQSNSFIAILESKGPGTLVHPTRGVVQAGCVNARVKDDILEGYGVSFVDLEFVEAGKGKTGLGASLFGVPIDSFVSAIGVDFTSVYNIASVPFYETGTILDAASSVFSTINTALRSVIGNDRSSALWSQVASLSRASSNPEANRDGQTVWSVLSQGFYAIDRFGTTSAARYNAFRSIANSAAKQSALSSSAGYGTENAIYSATRLIAAAFMARTSSQIVTRTLNDAISRIDAISTILSQEKESARIACASAFYIQIRDFEVMVQSQLTNLAIQTPAKIVYSFNGVVSSHVAAYRIYGDAKRFSDIEAANPWQPPFALGPDVIAIAA